MRRKHLPYLLAVALALGAVGAPAQETGTATVRVSLPADARLYFDDTLMRQTGPTRTFTTPPLRVGTTYEYVLKAEVVRLGAVLTQSKPVTVKAGDVVRVDFSSLGAEPAADGPPADASAADAGWPRKIVGDGNTVTVYQPQVEKWEGNRLELRAAVSVETQASPQPTFGVLWATARTEVDKENRQVTLENVQITKVNFPSAPDKAKEYLDLLRRNVPPGTRTVALDRIEASLAVTQAEGKRKAVAVKNDVPEILVSTKPAVLVLIDGPPALRQVEGGKLLRVINTRALVLFDEPAGKYYLRLMDRWMQAGAAEGPWSEAANPPAVLDQALPAFRNNPQVDLLDNLAADIKDAFENGTVPEVYVRTAPAELIETEGEPDLAPIDGTKLLWVKNTTSQVLLDTADQNYYVLLSGRWFRAKALKGPWEFVPADKLPADFARVPETHPRGDVLASVAGTPQAREAVIANGVPQTAAVRRGEARIDPVYDGKPQFEPVGDTPLKYAVNSPTPVIQVEANRYYAVENGVWFTAAAPTGPWIMATSVPAAVYTIPPSSPIYYVTNTYVYDATPDVVYVGCTPGYFGTCVCPQGVVVFGTGWAFRPWVGTYWFGRPWTYGWGARFCWTAGGWGFGFAAGVGRPWWGPIGWHAGWGGSGWRPGWQGGWGGRYADVHLSHLNFGNFNVYNRWGDNVYVNRVRNAFLGPRRDTTVHRGVNNLIAGADGGVFRRATDGWETHTADGWKRFEPNLLPAERRPQFENAVRRLDDDWAARRLGEAGANNFRSAAGEFGRAAFTPVRTLQPTQTLPSVGGYGGFHGGYGGFRGVSGYYPNLGGFRGGFRGRR